MDTAQPNPRVEIDRPGELGWPGRVGLAWVIEQRLGSQRLGPSATRKKQKNAGTA